MFVRIGDRVVNLARADTIDYHGPCGVEEDDRLTIDFGEASGGDLVLSGAEARAAWTAIAAACPGRAPATGPDIVGPGLDPGQWAAVLEELQTIEMVASYLAASAANRPPESVSRDAASIGRRVGVLADMLGPDARACPGRETVDTTDAVTDLADLKVAWGPGAPGNRLQLQPDSPAGRVAWAEQRLRDLAASAETGTPPTGPDIRAAANQLRAALAEMARPGTTAARYRVWSVSGTVWSVADIETLGHACESISRLAGAPEAVGHLVERDGQPWARLEVEAPGVWSVRLADGRAILCSAAADPDHGREADA